MQSTAPDQVPGVRDAALHVMVGILRDARGRILISRRHGDVHLSGYWEFPGGKLEPNEAAFTGLARELDEELGIRVRSARPMTQVRHRFPERSVLLDVWDVQHHTGAAAGLEGQEIAWVEPCRLPDYRFPESNQPILRALRLPDFYPVTPDEKRAEPILHAVCRYQDAGHRLIQFRAPRLAPKEWQSVALDAARLCERSGAQLLLNAPLQCCDVIPAAGVHLSAAEMMRTQSPLNAARPMLVGASCHNAAELHRAVALGVDFVTVSPVLPTPSHPQQNGIGWQSFSGLVTLSPVPVYALGGLGPPDLEMAQRRGAWGVAGIRGFGCEPVSGARKLEV